MSTCQERVPCGPNCCFVQNKDIVPVPMMRGLANTSPTVQDFFTDEMWGLHELAIRFKKESVEREKKRLAFPAPCVPERHVSAPAKVLHPMVALEASAPSLHDMIETTDYLPCSW